MSAPVCVITGAGPGNGQALARRFSAAGYTVALLARSTDRLMALAAGIDGAHAYTVDVGDAQALEAVFVRIREELGPVSALIHNAGSGVFKEFRATTPAELEQAWRTNTLALLVAGQQAAADMRSAGHGQIIVIGATASLRGNVATAAFASAKAAQRSLTQSMAKSLGPEGIHVAYVVIDGVIDIPRTRAFLPDKPDEYFLKPAAIADAVFGLTRQHPSAWTFELDLRPYAEKW